MTEVLVPVRFPLTEQSKATLARAIEVAAEQNAVLTVFHVNLYHSGRRVSRRDLKAAVEKAFDDLPDIRYSVRNGLLVEEAILHEVSEQRPDTVVIGGRQVSRWRRMVRRIIDDPDIAQFLEGELDTDIVTV